MTPLRVDEVAGILPELDELQPVLDLLFSRAVPDPERTWTGSGELGTVGDRLVPADALEGSAEPLADAARERLLNLYGAVTRAVAAAARGEPVAAAEALLEAGALEEEDRRLDRAAAYARAAHRTVQGERDAAVRAHCLRRLARALRGLGELEEAGARYEQAHELAAPSDERREAAVAAIGRGNVSVDRGRWSEAETWYRRAANLLDGADEDPELWQVELNLSIVARRKGDLAASRSHLETAERLAEEVADETAEAILENGWGMLHRAEGDAEEAVRRFRGALDAAWEPLARVTTTVNLGEALLDLGQSLEAGELGRDAERVALTEGVVPKLPEVYRLLGKVAREHGHDDALVFYEKALEIIRARGLPDFERAQTLEGYAAVERDAGRMDSARARLREAADLYDELGIAEESERVRSLLASAEGGGSGSASEEP